MGKRELVVALCDDHGMDITQALEMADTLLAADQNTRVSTLVNDGGMSVAEAFELAETIDSGEMIHGDSSHPNMNADGSYGPNRLTYSEFLELAEDS